MSISMVGRPISKLLSKKHARTKYDASNEWGNYDISKDLIQTHRLGRSQNRGCPLTPGNYFLQCFEKCGKNCPPSTFVIIPVIPHMVFWRSFASGCMMYALCMATSGHGGGEQLQGR